MFWLAATGRSMSEGSERPPSVDTRPLGVEVGRPGREARPVGEPSSRGSVMHPERVTLVVDGTHFVVDPALFTAHPDTMLGRCVQLACSICLPGARSLYATFIMLFWAFYCSSGLD